MPIYEYRCKDCGKTHELEHGFNDERPTSCPSCGGHLARVFHPVGLVFKGSGFYKTDHASPGARKAGEDSGLGSDGAKTDGKPVEAKPDAKAPAPSEKKPSPESKPAPKSGDAKPAPGSSKS